MSSDFPSTGERTEVPQPVKKRGRFSVLGEDASLNFEGRQPRQLRQREPVPDGFVRYELDEDDSEDDPDFEAEADAVEDEDDDDQYDDFENINDQQLVLDESRRADAELNQLLEQARTQTPRRRHVSRDLNSQRLPHQRHYPGLSVSAVPFEHGPREDADFEVDDLDSTDEEDVFDASELPGDGDGADQLDVPEDSGDFSAAHETDDVEVDELDEAESDEEEEEAEDGEEEEEAPDEYQQFLMGLLADTGDQQDASEQGGANGVTGNLPPPSWAMDDDDDFDYLRESARVQDDPLEYRDDLQVSRKELVQLFSNSTGAGLRRQTRHSRGVRGGRSRQPAMAVPPAAIPRTISAVPSVLPSDQISGRGALAPSLRVPNVEPISIQKSFQPYVALPRASFMRIPAHSLYQFHEQLSVHVQILTTIHAETRKASRLAHEQSVHQGSNSQEIQDLVAKEEAANRSEILIRGLIENKKVSTMYHQTLGTNISRLKSFSDKMLHRDRTSPFKYESWKSTIYSLPVLDLLERFISDCRTVSLEEMPAEVLSRFKEFDRPDITQALCARPQGRQYSASGSGRGWFPWTAEDDRLLAMTMAKYGSEIGEFSKDLLPHRQEDDCQTRVRYLSSRRCPDNPVKRQVMLITSPLNKEEAALVRRGLDKFGRGNSEDASVWKRIQAELLPGREWSHLQKLWNWRETRRKYKAKYRARAYEKKKAMRADTAPV